MSLERSQVETTALRDGLESAAAEIATQETTIATQRQQCQADSHANHTLKVAPSVPCGVHVRPPVCSRHALLLTPCLPRACS